MRGIEAAHYVSGHHIGLLEDRAAYLGRLERYGDRIRDRERHLLEYLEQPRTIEDIVAHRFIYRAHDKGAGIGEDGAAQHADAPRPPGSGRPGRAQWRDVSGAALAFPARESPRRAIDEGWGRLVRFAGVVDGWNSGRGAAAGEAGDAGPVTEQLLDPDDIYPVTSDQFRAILESPSRQGGHGEHLGYWCKPCPG